MNINFTVFVESVIFFGFIWATMKSVWPSIDQIIEQRQADIAEGARAAEDAKQSLKHAAQSAETIIQEARLKAANIIDQANTTAQQAITNNDAQLAQKTKQHELQIAQLWEQTKQQQHDEIQELILTTARQLTEQLLDQTLNKTQQKALISQLSQSTGEIDS